MQDRPAIGKAPCNRKSALRYGRCPEIGLSFNLRLFLVIGEVLVKGLSSLSLARYPMIELSLDEGISKRLGRHPVMASFIHWRSSVKLADVL